MTKFTLRVGNKAIATIYNDRFCRAVIFTTFYNEERVKLLFVNQLKANRELKVRFARKQRRLYIAIYQTCGIVLYREPLPATEQRKLATYFIGRNLINIPSEVEL